MLRPFLFLVLLLMGLSTVGVGQKNLKRAKGRPSTVAGSALKVSEPPPEDLMSVSASGRLRLGGACTGLLGILEIETDMSLEGPILIDVSANGTAVSQRAGDLSGRLELQLTRKKRISVAIKLGKGRNLIQVIDAANREERAALEWIGVVDNQFVVAEDPSDTRETDSQTTQSPSGRLSVTGLHMGEQARLDVAVGTLIGPFTIKVIDDSRKVVVDKKKELKRGETSFAETLPLETGRYLVTIASDDADEKAEKVTLGPWSFKTPRAADADTTSTAKEIRVSESNFSASIARVKDGGQLKVHIPDQMRGFKVRVVDADEKEVDSRMFSNLNRGTNDWSLSVKAAKGENTVTVSSLDDAESVVLSLPAAAAPKPAQGSVQPPADLEELVEYDWGRVRGYFSAGMIFSKERDDFSHSDMFLDFALDKNYVARPWFKIWPNGPNGEKHFLFKDLNTFFDARLTAIPVTAKDTSASEGDQAEAEECNTPDCEAFLTSKKAAMMQAGIYLPMYWDFTTWYRNDKTATGKDRPEKNALFIAPLAKGGILTVTGDRQTAEARKFGSDDVFNFYSFGAMLGHFRLHTRENSNGEEENNPNIAPELISWLTISAGRWENFEIEVPTGQKDAEGNDINVRRRPWRIEALGRLKIPETPFIIGFEGNFGKGPDDVRFLFGTRFDVGKIIRTLKLAAAEGELGKGP